MLCGSLDDEFISGQVVFFNFFLSSMVVSGVFFFLQDVVSWCFAVIAAGSPQIFSADGSHQRQKRIFDYVSREAKTISLSFRC